MTELSPAVFLSYASEDAEQARRICEALRAAGIEVWFDQSELRGGDDWDRKIRHQIRHCALFVPIISAHSHSRLEGYFRREWKLAADRTLDMAEDKPFLVPVVIDGSTQRGSAVPDKFKDLHWTYLPAAEVPHAFIERIALLLLAHPGGSPTAHPSRLTAPSTAPKPPGSARAQDPVWRSRAAIWTMIAFTLIACSYFLADRQIPARRVLQAETATPSSIDTAAHAASEIPEKSIAVLPFVDMSENHDQEYFGDGMAEEILNLLVKLPQLKVIGRTSSFQFKGKTDDLRRIGTSLGVAYVVEGSVRRSGNHVRVTAQLIGTQDGAHRWSETYDRDASDVLKVQGEIAASLAAALQLELDSLTHIQSRSPPKSREAYDLYLRGLHALNRMDRSGFEEAVADFRQTLTLDPTFVPAAEQLAVALRFQSDFGFVASKSGWEQARVAAEAARKLDANSAAAHAVLGMFYAEYDWNWPAAETELQIAMAQAPNLATNYAAQERTAVGDWNEALRLHNLGIAANPLNGSGYVPLSWVYVRLGRFAEAELALRRALAFSPNAVSLHYQLAIVLLLENKPEAALEELQNEPDDLSRLDGLVVIYPALHRIKDADTALARLEATHSQDDALTIAQAYAFRRQKDQAFKWLESAYAQKDGGLWLIKGDPLLKNLEEDPRYAAFLRKMNLPP